MSNCLPCLKLLQKFWLFWRGRIWSLWSPLQSTGQIFMGQDYLPRLLCMAGQVFLYKIISLGNLSCNLNVYFIVCRVCFTLYVILWYRMCHMQGQHYGTSFNHLMIKHAERWTGKLLRSVCILHKNITYYVYFWCFYQ